MKRLEDYRELMIGTRLKRLSERLFTDVDAVYKANDIELPSSAFASLAALRDNGPMGISELADALGQTHSAISQISKRLMKEELVDSGTDSKDERKRMLELNDKGRELIRHVQPLWQDIERAMASAIEESGVDFIAAVQGLEQAFSKASFQTRIELEGQKRREQSVEVFRWDPALQPEFRADFKTLNVEWLVKYFYVEAIDDQVLSYPEEEILEPGGFIFFAKIKDKIVGTSCLIKESDDSFELSKMSVTDGYKGLGIGRKLAEAAINEFKATGANNLFLESNSRLSPALKLYESLGFEHRPLKQDSHYSRADVHMVWVQKSNTAKA